MKLLCIMPIIVVLLLFILLVADKKKRAEITAKYRNRQCEYGDIDKVDGYEICYIEVGEGIPLLIIHGFMASCIEYTEIIKILSKKYKIIAVDLIGFGRSDKRTELDYSKKNMADVIAAFLINKKYKEVNVLGHSMGGEVALNLAISYKSMVKSLILVNSVGCIDIAWPVMPKFLIQHIFKMYYVQRLFYKFCFCNKSLCDYEKFERIYYLNCCIPCKTISTFLRCNDKYKIGEEIKTIKCPTLIICGKYDRVVHLKNAYRFKDDIKNSELVIFECSGHLPYCEEESKFIRVVEDFMNANN